MAHVLIIDDDENIRDYAAEILRVAGYDVSTSHTAKDLTAEVRLSPPDAVLLDYLMPDMDGLTALRQLRVAHEAVPVIIMTATPEQTVAIECFRAGADDFISKPFDPEFLEIIVRRAIDHGSSNLRDMVLSLLRYVRHLENCAVHKGMPCSCSMNQTVTSVSNMMKKRPTL